MVGVSVGLLFFTFLTLGIEKGHGLDLSSSPSFLSGELSLSLENEDPDLANFFVDQVHDLQMDLTRSFIAQHGRRKREILRYSYEASLSSKNEGGFETRSQSVSYPCLYKNQTLILQEDGIYYLSDESQGQTLTMSKVNSWKLDRGERVLKTYEWNGVLFILTANGQKTKLYTLAYHGSSYKLRMKQEMRSEGYPTAATFFEHAFDLYLILAMDNRAHSLIISPIYRWSRTYMDQIHEIQTRGAVDVVAFPVTSYTYVAIAQAEDAAGNQEVGTLVLRMYGRGEVEKVQLLWSIHAVSVSYVRFLEEHFLVIGQRDEASICYWLGGYHFAYWQSLPGLLGNSVFLDSYTLPDNEPLLLGSTESSVGIYTRRKVGSARESSSLNLTSIVYITSSSERILDARFLQRGSGYDQKLYIALSLQSQSKYSLQILPLALTKVPVEAQVDTEDKMSSCMNSLRRALDEDEISLAQIEGSLPSVITKSGDWQINGKVTSKGSLTVPEGIVMKHVLINPLLKDPEDRCEYSPSYLMTNSQRQLDNYEDLVNQKLGNVLLKSKPGNITAHFKFPNGLRIKNLKSTSPIKLETLNGISWQTLETEVLRNDVPNQQVVSGNWKIQTLKANEIETGNRIGKAYIPDFLLTTSQNGKPRDVDGTVIFGKDIEVEDLLLGPYVSLNGIPFGEIALRSEGGITEIRGYKTGESVKGGQNAEVDLINGIKLRSWYENTLKIDDVKKEWATGNKTFGGDLTIQELTLETLNGKDWNEFAASVLLNGVDQDVDGELICAKLKVNDLYVDKINAVKVDDWMTTSTAQDINSDIYILSQAQFRQNIYSKSINVIQLGDALLRTDTNVRISGPLEFTSLTLGNLTLDSYTTLNGLNIAAAAKLRKKHIYSCAEELSLDGNVEVDELEAGSLNGVRFGSIQDAYWRVNGNNQINCDFQFGSAKIQVNEFSTGTLNSLRLEEDTVRLSSDGLISRNLQFSSDVLVKGPVIMADGAMINTYDISKVETDIVRMSDGARRIGGRKEFVDSIEARGGIEVNEINGIYVKKELVFLDGYGRQDLGKKYFEEVVAQEVESEVDVKVTGLVNGVELKSIAEKSIYADTYDETIKIYGDVIFEKSLSADALIVQNEINGIKVNEILSNVISLDGAEELQRPLIISEGKLQFLAPAEVDTINGISPGDYLSKVVSQSDDATYSGTYEFGTVVVDGDLACDFLNNINLTQLEASAFSKTKQQIISGRFVIQELQSQGNLITSSFSGISISDFIRTDQNARIRGDVIFKADSVTVEGQILLQGLLNNYKIEEVAEYLKGLEGNRKFGQITVDGNLSWDVSDHSHRRLSHLLSNAVTINTPQTIRGRVTFACDLEMKTLQTDQWIKGVDLAFILEDSLQQRSYEAVEFKGQITFEQEIVVKSRDQAVIVKGHLSTPKINGIILKELYQQVVRKNSPRRIYGTKTFTRGLSVHKLNVFGKIDGVDVKELITFDDERQVDQVTMSGVTISQDLHFKRLNGYDLEYYFPDRITIDKNHEIGADWIFHQNIVVKNCDFHSINDLRLSNIFRRKSLQPQRITGEKCFEKLVIEGSLEDVLINGIGLDKIEKEALRLDRDEVILRHVTFMDTVHLAGPLDITGSGAVNEYSIDSVAEAFTSSLDDLVENMLVSDETKEKATSLILDLEKAQENQGFWLDYVEDREWLTEILDGPTLRVESFLGPDEHGKVTVAFHGETLETGGVLPIGCACTTIDFLQFDTEVVTVDRVKCLRIFDVPIFGAGNNDVSYTIYSNVLSYNKTCSRRETGETFVSISQNDNERYRIKESRLLKPDWSVGRLDGNDFISDAKAFTVGKKSYLIIAQSYDPSVATHHADVLVFETTYDRLEKVQTLEAHGARRMALIFVNENWILVIGNEGEENEEGENCPTESSIYQWSTLTGEFLLLRSVATRGLVDVSLLTIVDDDGEFVEAYAAFAQNEPTNFGKVSIYKYLETNSGETFELYQEIEVDGVMGGLKSFSVGGISYWMFAVPSSGLQFYQHLHLEGFKYDFTVQVKEASDVGFFIQNNEVFIPISSADSHTRGVLTQAIFQGRLIQ